MSVRVRLYPPLNTTAHRDRLELSLGEEPCLGGLVTRLVERFGPDFRRHFYDDRDRLVPAWCAFVNGKAVHFNRPEALSCPLQEGDEVDFLLALAGG